MRKPIIFLMLLVLLLCPVTSVAYAENVEDTAIENPYFVSVTKAQVYHSSGRIYIATHYKFDLDKTYEYELDGETVVLNYVTIIDKIRNLYNNQLDVIYDESLPNEVVIVNKIYNSRWEMNHDLGITGDEIDDPLPKKEEFFFTTYISEAGSYLANQGKEVLEVNYKLLAMALFGIDTVDMSMFKFNYCYGTDYKSITSNADNVIHEEDMYYHIFENIDENSNITLYQRVPNTKNWYGVIIGVSVGVIVLGLGIYLIIRKRRKNG